MTTTPEPFSTAASQAHFHRACQLMPGGVNSPARAFGAVGGDPVFIQRGEGPFLYDVDGNRYIDYVGSWGPLILGHAHPAVREAIHRAVDAGTSFGAPTERENQLAEVIIDAVPSIDKVRLVNSGTEATMSAIRVARGFTGRDRIIKFAGNYHGHADSLLVAAGSAGATFAVPNSPGVPAGTASDTIVLRYNDVGQLEETFQVLGNSIAALIVEPVAGNMGCVAPSMEFLRATRDLTERFGSVLIFDEVITGFRLAYGGAQSRFDILPDLTTLGKIVGGGLPLAAYGGRRQIMDQVLPVGKVYQAGTLSGNPVATAAGLATLLELKRNPPYERLEQLTLTLAAGWSAAAERAQRPHVISRVGSMFTLFFQSGPVHDWESASNSDTDRYSEFFWSMLRRGVYLPCSQFESLFVSDTHTSELIDETVTIASRVICQK